MANRFLFFWLSFSCIIYVELQLNHFMWNVHSTNCKKKTYSTHHKFVTCRFAIAKLAVYGIGTNYFLKKAFFSISVKKKLTAVNACIAIVKIFMEFNWFCEDAREILIKKRYAYRWIKIDSLNSHWSVAYIVWPPFFGPVSRCIHFISIHIYNWYADYHYIQHTSSKSLLESIQWNPHCAEYMRTMYLYTCTMESMMWISIQLINVNGTFTPENGKVGILVGTLGSVSHFNIDSKLVPIFQSVVFAFRHSRTLHHNTK